MIFVSDNFQDRERGIPSSMPRNALDEQFNDRIKSMEQRITTGTPMRTDKKPKDLLRKIGKIESTDWNIREIERKMEESKKPEVGKSFEKVPKWSKEQFQQLQNKMAQAAPEQESTDERFKEIEQTIKNVDKQLKDSALWELRERGKNKVASLAGSFVKKDNNIEAAKSIPRSVSQFCCRFHIKLQFINIFYYIFRIRRPDYRYHLIQTVDQKSVIFVNKKCIIWKNQQRKI